MISGFYIVHTISSDFEDSKTAIFTQTFACGSLFALSTGHFAVAADFARALINVPGHERECGYWILRALAFAGMGECLIFAKLEFVLIYSFVRLSAYRKLILVSSTFENRGKCLFLFSWPSRMHGLLR